MLALEAGGAFICRECISGRFPLSP
jgi:hypothetical protein